MLPVVSATGVVPTHVGVSRPRPRPTTRPRSRPHARGGEPTRRTGGWWPRSVVPTHVGVSRLSRSGKIRGVGRVVPTHVGVTHASAARRTRRPGRPHARGGGPGAADLREEPNPNSPLSLAPLAPLRSSSLPWGPPTPCSGLAADGQSARAWLRARPAFGPRVRVAEVPQMGTLTGHGCWDRHAARAWLHVLVSVSAAYATGSGDRLLRSQSSLRARYQLLPAGTEVPQMGRL